MLTLPHIWKEKKSSPVAIFGRGVSGQGVAKLLSKLEWKFNFYDIQEVEFSEEAAKISSMVITSPGFPADHPWIRLAHKSNLTVVGELDFASTLIDNEVVAVTGTNGKTSLVTFLAHLWKRLGKSVVCAGNVGTSLSEVVVDGLDSQTSIFLEVSSFQAAKLKFLKPSSLLWTNFSSDHLDYHKNLEKYFLAKFNLCKRLRSDGNFICGRSVVEFGGEKRLKVEANPEVVDCSRLSSLNIKEDHFFSSPAQRENLSIAYAYAESKGIKKTEFEKAIQDYQPEPFRLSKVGVLEEVSFWNDSKATNFSAVLSACKNFRERIIWIGGGKEKGDELQIFSSQMKEYLIQAFLIGEVAEKLAILLRKESISVTVCNTLKDAVGQAFSVAKRGTSIVFSPGFASFDMFTSYLERGNLFNQVFFDLKKRYTPCTQEESI